MPLAIGARLGSYEVVSALGAGGMGEVYRARDTKLGRDVAIKILPDAVVHDPERVARFEREAKLLAALNHPHIAAIHGFEEANPSTGSGQAAVRFLVLELVEGGSLADKLAFGSELRASGTTQSLEPKAQSLPVNEALAIARQIVEALEAAHEKGIIHRDLKPGNIMLTPDGQVKVLDFGLAKSEASEAGQTGAGGLTHSPTLSMGITHAGLILGTAAYMSPEQAKGRAADKRSDVWAFGCVLYEMLAGKRAFDGEDVTEIIAAVVRGEPDWNALPSDVPDQIRLLIRRCLEKDRRARIGDISVARFLMTETIGSRQSPEPEAEGPKPENQSPKPQSRRLVWAGIGLLALVAVVGVGGWAAMKPAPSASPQLARFAITLPVAQTLTISGLDRDIAISPDGSRIVYRVGNPPQLVVRAIDQLDATPIAGTLNARSPFISPDGRWVGFFIGAGGDLEIKRVSIAGGPVTTLCRLRGAPRGASWGDDDTIVFATGDVATGLMSVPAMGGEPKILTRPDNGQEDHVRPSVLPGARAVLFTIIQGTGNIATNNSSNSQVAILDLRSGTRQILIQGGSQAEYAATGHLVFATADSLRAVRFDLSRLQVLGDSIPAVEQVNAAQGGAANFALSAGGTLVFVPGFGTASRTLVWVDRQGREEPLTVPLRAYTYPRISPDGKHVALDVRDRNNDIWILDVALQTLTPLTFDPGVDVLPVWTRDGRRIVFSSARNGPPNLFWQAFDGTGPTERLTTSPNQQIPSSFSIDQSRLVFQELVADGRSDIGLLTLGDKPATELLIHSSFDELNADISPDGHWLAYQSNESGQREVWVKPFPNVESGRWQISSAGGTRPLWARSGRELFYLDVNNSLTSVPVQTTGATFNHLKPTKILDTAYWAIQTGRTYDESPDGRFLMIKDQAATQTSTATPASLVVVLNWFEELKARAPAVK